jgi:hypothetical protein
MVMNPFLLVALLSVLALIFFNRKKLKHLGNLLHEFADTYNSQYAEGDEAGEAPSKAD